MLENCYLKGHYKIGRGEEWGLCLMNTQEILKTGNCVENCTPKYLIRCGCHCSSDKFVYLKAKQCPSSYKMLTELSKKMFIVKVIVGYEGLACAGCTSYIARK